MWTSIGVVFHHRFSHEVFMEVNGSKNWTFLQMYSFQWIWMNLAKSFYALFPNLYELFSSSGESITLLQLQNFTRTSVLSKRRCGLSHKCPSIPYTWGSLKHFETRVYSYINGDGSKPIAIFRGINLHQLLHF